MIINKNLKAISIVLRKSFASIYERILLSKDGYAYSTDGFIACKFKVDAEIDEGKFIAIEGFKSEKPKEDILLNKKVVDKLKFKKNKFPLLENVALWNIAKNSITLCETEDCEIINRLQISQSQDLVKPYPKESIDDLIMKVEKNTQYTYSISIDLLEKALKVFKKVKNKSNQINIKCHEDMILMSNDNVNCDGSILIKKIQNDL